MSTPEDKQGTQEEQRRRRIAESITQQIEKVDTKSELEFINEVMDTITEPPRKIPEPVFREIFMPYFTGEKKATDKDPAIAHWAGLVNGGTESAEVVDMKGEVLFTVPPLFNSRKINALRTDRSQSYSSIFTEFSTQATVHKGMATREMASQLGKKLDGALSEEEKAAAEGWSKIRRYYGLEAKALGNDQANRPSAEEDPDLQW